MGGVHFLTEIKLLEVMMGPGGDFQNLQEEETNTKSIKPMGCYIKPSEETIFIMDQKRKRNRKTCFIVFLVIWIFIVIAFVIALSTQMKGTDENDEAKTMALVDVNELTEPTEPVTTENFTSENVNENSIGENVGKMNENFKEKQKAFWNEIKKMSPF